MLFEAVLLSLGPPVLLKQPRQCWLWLRWSQTLKAEGTLLVPVKVPL
jgi:hypothetical protein